MRRGVVTKAVKWVAVAAMCSLPMQGFGANVAANTVVSSSIKPADGTTGQSLTTGSGVKTGHIQDKAVTAAKLGIVCPTGQYLQYNGTTWVCSAGTAGPQGVQGLKGDTGATGPQGPAGIISDGSVTTNTIADGAVTSAKISGLISADKLSGYAGVKIVHTGPADGNVTFNSITNALASIGTTTERYVIQVMPGIYTDDINLLGTVSNVDIVGSSRLGTIIKPSSGFMIMGTGLFLKNLTVEGRVYFSSPYYGGRDDDATNAGISNCTIKSTGTTLVYDHLGAVYMSMNANSITIEDSTIEHGHTGIKADYIYNPDTIAFKNLTITNISAQYGSTGIYISPYDRYAPITNKYLKVSNIDIQGTGNFALHLASNAYVILDNVSISNIGNGWNIGLYGNASDSIKVSNSKIDSFDAIMANSGSIFVDNSTIKGRITGNGGSINIGSTKILGSQLSGSRIKIVNSYDSNYDPINNGVYGTLAIP